MATFAKYRARDALLILRHNAREIKNPSNEDIDPRRTPLNYSLLNRPLSEDIEHYKMRKKEIHAHNRKDVITLVGLVITAPGDLPEKDERSFFETSLTFVSERFGAENIVQAVVHHDESGQPHMHIGLLPVVADAKYGEKFCAKEVITRQELNTFHPDFQRYLDNCGIHARVFTGVTTAQGGNRSVADMKRIRDLERERDFAFARLAEIERGKEHTRSRWNARVDAEVERRRW